MRSRLSRRTRRLVAVAAVLFAVGAVPAWAAFVTATTNEGNVVSAAPDFVAPTSSAAAAAKTPGYDEGYVRQGGTYHIYANVGDTGNPASGVSSVTVDASTISAGQGSVPLAAGSFSSGGQTYNRRSAALTADAVKAAGTYSLPGRMTDGAGNTRALNLSVIVDNTPPTAQDIQIVDGGGTVSRPQAGDVATFTFSEPVDPQSVLAGWNGSATDVTVRMVNNSTSDLLTVHDSANTTQLPLGTVRLNRTDYVGGDRTFGAPATTRSRMTRSGNTITVTLGTPSGTTTTAAGTAAMTWTPLGSGYDRAGNPFSTLAATESGTLDRDF